jgi:hypothetical protein
MQDPQIMRIGIAHWWINSMYMWVSYYKYADISVLTDIKHCFNSVINTNTIEYVFASNNVRSCTDLQ